MTPPGATQQLREAQQALQAGQLPQAERILRDLLSGEPTNATALQMLGLALAQTGRRSEGYTLIERSIAAQPQNVKFRQNYAVLLAYSDLPGDPRRALDVIRDTLAIAPDSKELWQLLRDAGERAGMSRPLINDWLLSATLPKPTDDAAAWVERGIALDNIGDLAGASTAFRRAVALDPNDATAAREFALFLIRSRAVHTQSIPAIRRALELVPPGEQADELRANLGLQLAESGNVRDGEAMLRTLVEQDQQRGRPMPKHLRALAAVLQVSARADEAAEFFERSVAAAGDDPDPTGLMQLLFNALYISRDDPAALLARHRELERRYTAKIRPLPPRPITSVRGRRLKIGYVSGDFRDSSVAKFLLPLMEAQAKARRVEIHCFATQEHVDNAYTPRFRAGADAWHPAYDINDDVLAAAVRASSIDVLIDLSGYTAGTRLLAFAYRAAPLQMTYLGYPCTSGLSSVDCRITDVVADPPGQTEAFHSERLLRLPHSFGLFRPPDEAPPVAPAPFILNGYVTFGSASYAAKLNDSVIETWAAALRAAPPSTRMLLINAAYADDGIRARLSARFAAQGVDPQRLEFVGRLKFEDYLRAHARVDLMLDTFPFNGHTTTVQHLWMGVPVLTLAGQSHRGRMGASVLTTVGLPQLIASDRDDFVARAARFAHEPQRLADLRDTLRARMQASPLMDEDGFARDFDQLLIDEWERRAEQFVAQPSRP